MYKMDENH